MPIYKSPSTSLRSVDLVKTKIEDPTGTPAIVIGTSRRGIPFVPITVENFTDFIANFGDIDSERFAPLAMERWLLSRSAGTFIKIGGTGKGNPRLTLGSNAGTVEGAGFIVGEEQVNSSSGILGKNIHAYDGGPPGRTYFLGCFMSESAGSTIFTDAGIQSKGTNKSHPILRGVILTPSGVTLSLNSKATINNNPTGKATNKFSATDDAGLSYGDVLIGPGHEQKFIMLLNGFKPNELYKNIITASFDPQAESSPTSEAKYFSNVMNTNPDHLEKAGHYLHLFHDVSVKSAEITGSGITLHNDLNTALEITTAAGEGKMFQTAFLLTSSLSRNTGSQTSSTHVGVPNFENFSERYQPAFSPTVISQTLMGRKMDLFKIYTKDIGSAASLNYKITINNFVTPGLLPQTPYPSFDLYVRKITQSDLEFGSTESNDGIFEYWPSLNLNPSSDRFISKVIGDTHTFYDFDKKDQKVASEGNYKGHSRIIRVKTSKEVDQGEAPAEALPIGFRGLHHLVTSGSCTTGAILTGSAVPLVGSEGTLVSSHGITTETVKSIIQPPVPMREHISILDSGTKEVNNVLTWGFQSEVKESLLDPNNSSIFNTSSLSYMMFMPDFHEASQKAWIGNNHGTSDINGCIFDADRFNNNIFSLERIEVITSSLNVPDSNKWSSALYRRAGKTIGHIVDTEGVARGSRFLTNEDFKHVDSQNYYQFTFPLIGGFDGTNIFDSNKRSFTNASIVRESLDPKQGQQKGTTITAYKKAVDILEDKNYQASILTIPGIRHTSVADYALELVNDRKDMFLIMDIEEKDDLNVTLTGSYSPTAESIKNTRNYFTNNPRLTSYGAAYWPDLMITNPKITEDEDFPGTRVPPSVCVIGLMGRLPDHTRIIGPVNGNVDALATTLSFEDNQIDEFYQSGINIISGPSLTEGPGSTESSGPFLRSQFSLMHKSPSAMSYISTRRMMLFVRKQVREVLETQIFEKITSQLYSRIKSQLEDRLSSLQSGGVFKSFNVTTPKDLASSRLDVNNNTVRVKVLILPNDVKVTLQIEESVNSNLPELAQKALS